MLEERNLQNVPTLDLKNETREVLKLSLIVFFHT